MIWLHELRTAAERLRLQGLIDRLETAHASKPNDMVTALRAKLAGQPVADAAAAESFGRLSQGAAGAAPTQADRDRAARLIAAAEAAYSHQP